MIKSIPILGKLLISAHANLQRLKPEYVANYRLKPIIAQACVTILRRSINVEQIILSKEECIIASAGARFCWNPRDPYSLLGYPLRGDFEELETSVTMEIARQSACFVDVGGNFGWYTCHVMGVLFPGGVIHVFEPVPSIREELKKNIALNARHDVSVIVEENCLSDGSGEVTLHVPKVHGAAFASMEAQDYKGGFDMVLAKTITLDEYCESAGITSVDFLKIDVEGAELKVLHGARGVLSKTKKPVILLESFPPLLEPFNCNLSDVLDYVKSFGYEGFIFHHGRLHALNSENAGKGYDYLFVQPGTQAFVYAQNLSRSH